jgi:hypothetical protein
MDWARVARMADTMNTYRIFVEKHLRGGGVHLEDRRGDGG